MAQAQTDSDTDLVYIAGQEEYDAWIEVLADETAQAIHDDLYGHEEITQDVVWEWIEWASELTFERSALVMGYDTVRRCTHAYLEGFFEEVDPATADLLDLAADYAQQAIDHDVRVETIRILSEMEDDIRL